MSFPYVTSPYSDRIQGGFRNTGGGELNILISFHLRKLTKMAEGCVESNLHSVGRVGWPTRPEEDSMAQWLEAGLRGKMPGFKSRKLPMRTVAPRQSIKISCCFSFIIVLLH